MRSKNIEHNQKNLSMDKIFLNQQKEQAYVNASCGVFKGGMQNQKGFWIKINCSQMKLLNFENWSSGELSKMWHQKDSDDFRRRKLTSEVKF